MSESAPLSTAAPERATVLVVEDDPVLNRLLVRQLAKAGYDVGSAHSWAEARERLPVSFRERLPVSLLALESVRRRLLGGLGVRPRSAEVGTISTSGFRSSLAGSSTPREAVTFDIESSIVTNCSPAAVSIRSDRATTGRISAVAVQT